MIDPFTKIISIILCFFILNFSSLIPGSGKDDIDMIAQNIVDGLTDGSLNMFEGPDIYDGDTIVSLIAYDADGDCYFSDIDYTNNDRTTWQAARHIKRAERLAVLYRQQTDTAKKEEYRAYILGLIDHWIKKDYQNPNWWHNKLCNPNVLGELGILMKDDLSKDQLLRLSELVGRGCFTVSPLLYAYTGANAIDLSMSTIKFGALTGSKTAVKTAVKVISGELKYSLTEGMKKDHTYFQHGNRLYMGGYGVTFINGITNIIAMLSGTEFIFTQKQFEPFAAFILDGMRKMSFGSTLDPTTMGRSVSRLNAQPLGSIVPALMKLSTVKEMPRRDEIKDFALSITNGTKGNYGLQYFDDAEFLVINDPDFYFSFRGGSNTMVYSEVVNDENVLGYNSSVPGVTTIMSKGGEYVNIAPIYDYSFVPGVTSVYETDNELKAHGDFSYRVLPGIYGGTYSDGAAVLSAKTSHDGIDMTVTCFATDNAAVILGAGMKDAKGRSMNTCIDQSYYAGSFTNDGGTVIHNGIKYTLIDGGELTAGPVHRTGNWRRNNLSYTDAPVEADLFNIYFKNSGAYAYSVSAENTEAEFEVIVNTEKVQAVRLPDGRIAAAFFAVTGFECDGKTVRGIPGEVKIF